MFTPTLISTPLCPVHPLQPPTLLPAHVPFVCTCLWCRLSEYEFCVAFHLVVGVSKKGLTLPTELPPFLRSPEQQGRQEPGQQAAQMAPPLSTAPVAMATGTGGGNLGGPPSVGSMDNMGSIGSDDGRRRSGTTTSIGTCLQYHYSCPCCKWHTLLVMLCFAVLIVLLC